MVIFIHDSFRIKAADAVIKQYMRELELLNVKLYFILVKGMKLSRIDVLSGKMKSLNTFIVPSLTNLGDAKVFEVTSTRIGNDLKGVFHLFCMRLSTAILEELKSLLTVLWQSFLTPLHNSMQY